MPKSESGAIAAVQVPTGGQFAGFANLKTESADCSADTNLLTQIAPLIASMSCQLKMLMLLKPLVNVIQSLPNPPVRALEEFSRAAEALAPCFLIPTPAGVVPFLRGLLCLEIRSLNCLLRKLKAIATLAGADPSGIAASEVRSVLDSYPPIVGILDLAGEFFQIGGLAIPKAPTLAGGTDPTSLNSDQDAVATFAAALCSGPQFLDKKRPLP